MQMIRCVALDLNSYHGALLLFENWTTASRESLSHITFPHASSDPIDDHMVMLDLMLDLHLRAKNEKKFIEVLDEMVMRGIELSESSQYSLHCFRSITKDEEFIQ